MPISKPVLLGLSLSLFLVFFTFLGLHPSNTSNLRLNEVMAKNQIELNETFVSAKDKLTELSHLKQALAKLEFEAGDLETKAKIQCQVENVEKKLGFVLSASPSSSSASLPSSTAGKTLIVYAYLESGYAKKNLDFFLKLGVTERPDVDYVFIIQNFTATVEFPNFSNVKIVKRENTCYDFGSWGLIFKSLPNFYHYKYYMVINSSIRGPFVPPILWGTMYDGVKHRYQRRQKATDLHWSHVFTSRLNEVDRLSGIWISCLGLKEGLLPKQFANPHVQSMLLAFEGSTLELLMKHDIFKCWDHKELMIQEGEIGVSRLLLENNFNIVSLLGPYQGIDFRKPENKNCGLNQSPQVSGNYGRKIDPYETLFIKAKDDQICDAFGKRVTALTKHHLCLASGAEECPLQSWPSDKECY
eukprot:TRINITY_DN8342_c0_g1_i3.p1 TRINITY_DN8342_c0_g1~~TRINITY_DN8342_c0_g1_i3.p1  ORF type:complete len:432 (+),score=112.10 TRINITY_DN8342_c0_g1_i3:57-1298(+)